MVVRPDDPEFDATDKATARYIERLRILHQIDRALIAGESPEAIAAAALPPVRELLGVRRAIVNLFDLEAGEVEWLAATGLRRVRVGPGVRYPLLFMGDVEALRRGENQWIDVHALPPSPEVDALLASEVHSYVVVPMFAEGELIGALSFGGASAPFTDEQVGIAQEVATQFAVALTQARLHERVQRQAVELEARVQERTLELEAAHAELQKSHAELVELTRHLQSANQELDAFTYSVSHDLRAPLRAIDGFSRIVLDEYAPILPEAGQAYLQKVRDNTARMTQLVNDLLAFSRLSRQPLQKVTVDPGAMVAVCLEELAAAREQRRVTIQVGDLPRCEADPNLLQQVWLNLLANALKFTGKQTHAIIEISCRMDAEPPIYFVKDNGVGFDMQYADKLFGVFQRLHRAEDYEGTGVGLAIVQQIIHRHGGSIWAIAQLDQGATFHFTLEATPRP